MGEYASAILLGFGSSVAAILGAWALVVRARASASEPRQLLRRLWDWLETAGLVTRMPPTLARDVRRTLDHDEEPDDDQDG